MIKKPKYIIGIDEVGRGSLAGPVVVAAVAVTKYQVSSIKYQARKSKLPLKDSKKLSPKQREAWFKIITKELALPYAIASVSPKIIDKINISQAANLAATRALNKLLKKEKKITASISGSKIFLDGGLYLNKNSIGIDQLNRHKSVSTIIKGDEKIPAISLASIIAKVYRDRLMKKLHKKYPRYDFINNVGYGTKKHIRAIKKRGHSPIHRKSFKIKRLIDSFQKNR